MAKQMVTDHITPLFKFTQPPSERICSSNSECSTLKQRQAEQQVPADSYIRCPDLHVLSRDFSGEFQSADDRVIHKISVFGMKYRVTQKKILPFDKT